MAIDMNRVVNCVRDDLKKAYSDNPSAVWDRPMVVVVNKGGETSVLDGVKSDEHIAGWLCEKVGTKKIEAVVIGRMVVKHGKFIDPTTGQLIITEKAILVSGRNFANGRTVVSITPTKEHRDYRSTESQAQSPRLIVPGLSSPDVTKVIKDEMGVTKGIMTGQFGKEKVFDSRLGERCALDPIIQGVVDAPKMGDIK